MNVNKSFRPVRCKKKDWIIEPSTTTSFFLYRNISHSCKECTSNEFTKNSVDYKFLRRRCIQLVVYMNKVHNENYTPGPYKPQPMFSCKHRPHTLCNPVPVLTLALSFPRWHYMIYLYLSFCQVFSLVSSLGFFLDWFFCFEVIIYIFYNCFILSLGIFHLLPGIWYKYPLFGM